MSGKASFSESSLGAINTKQHQAYASQWSSLDLKPTYSFPNNTGVSKYLESSVRSVLYSRHCNFLPFILYTVLIYTVHPIVYTVGSLWGSFLHRGRSLFGEEGGFTIWP